MAHDPGCLALVNGEHCSCERPRPEPVDVHRVLRDSGMSSWIWDDEYRFHMPVCTRLRGTRPCGNGPLTGQQIAEGDCGEDHRIAPEDRFPVWLNSDEVQLILAAIDEDERGPSNVRHNLEQRLRFYLDRVAGRVV